MTGPEHYQEAERLAKVAANEPEFNSERVNYCLASAQVHATLALVAATAYAAADVLGVQYVAAEAPA